MTGDRRIRDCAFAARSAATLNPKPQSSIRVRQAGYILNRLVDIRTGSCQ